ncbi:MAG: iron ABC transporter permease [Desulfomicrobiaceae bacterium]|nr:iron ABC transporter permease [Desulfomicrobiaceae bacterium]
MRPHLPWVAPPAWAPLIFLALFFAHPLTAILSVSFAQGGWQAAAVVLRDPAVHQVLSWTTFQALLSSGISVVLALPAAFFLSRVQFPGQGLASMLLLLPFVLPTVVVATAFAVLADPTSFLGRLTAPVFGAAETPGMAAILGAHVFYNLGLAARIMAGLWARIPQSAAHAAATLGAPPITIFFRVHLPLLAPGILASAITVFALCFSSFGVVLLLGGGRFATIEVAIYQATMQQLDLPRAGILAVLQLGCSALFFALASVSARSVPLHGQAIPTAWRQLPRTVQGAGILCGAILFAGLILPLVALILESFRVQNAWSLEAYRLLAQDPRQSALGTAPIVSLAYSLRYAALATALAVPLGLAAALGARRSRLRTAIETVCMLPMTTSAATLGLGLLLALRTPWWDARTAAWIIPVAHALVALPLVLRTLQPALEAISPQLGEAAATLGASPRQILGRITLPLLARPLAMATTVSLAVSLGEFGASLFLVRPTTPTLPVAIYRSLSLPGTTNHAQALALATILLATCAVLGLVAQRLWVGASHKAHP